MTTYAKYPGASHKHTLGELLRWALSNQAHTYRHIGHRDYFKRNVLELIDQCDTLDELNELAIILERGTK